MAGQIGTAENSADSPAPKVEWWRAARALATVMADTSRSEKVAELAIALEGDGLEKCYQRFRAHPEGQRLLRDKPSLVDALKDRTKIDALPEGTLGHAYRMYMREERLDAQEFTNITELFVDEDAKYDEDRRYFRRRLRDAHDVWHALTGYGADELGEAALLAFTQGQIPNLGVGVLASAAYLFAPLVMPSDRLRWQPYMIRAWIRGRRASWLPVVRWEDRLGRPLADVRRELRVEAPEIAHPRGIIAFSRWFPKVRRIKAA